MSRMVENDPCGIERKASMTCLDKNNYSRDVCVEYFEAYKACKSKYNLSRRTGVEFVRDKPPKEYLEPVANAHQ